MASHMSDSYLVYILWLAYPYCWYCSVEKGAAAGVAWGEGGGGLGGLGGGFWVLWLGADCCGWVLWLGAVVLVGCCGSVHGGLGGGGLGGGLAHRAAASCVCEILRV